MTRLLCVRLGAGPSSATLVNLHIVRRVALSQANIWSRRTVDGPQGCALCFGGFGRWRSSPSVPVCCKYLALERVMSTKASADGGRDVIGSPPLRSGRY